MAEKTVNSEEAAKKRKAGDKGSINGDVHVRDGDCATPINVKHSKNDISTSNTYEVLVSAFPSLSDVQTEEENKKKKIAELKEKVGKQDKGKSLKEIQANVGNLTELVLSLHQMMDEMKKEIVREKEENKKYRIEADELKVELVKKNEEIRKLKEENSSKKENERGVSLHPSDEKEKRQGEWTQVVNKSAAKEVANAGVKPNLIKACFSFKNTGQCAFGSACKFVQFHVMEKKPICFLFAKSSKCTRENCKFRHEPPGMGEVVFPKIKICRKFLLGKCQQQCPLGFVHQQVRKIDKVCRSWNAKEGCKFGNLCRFLHEKEKELIGDESKANDENKEDKTNKNEIEKLGD